LITVAPQKCFTAGWGVHDHRDAKDPRQLDQRRRQRRPHRALGIVADHNGPRLRDKSAESANEFRLVFARQRVRRLHVEAQTMHAVADEPRLGGGAALIAQQELHARAHASKNAFQHLRRWIATDDAKHQRLAAQRSDAGRDIGRAAREGHHVGV
jgi:hypothetical protein